MKTKIYFIDGTELTIDIEFKKVYQDINTYVGFVKYGQIVIQIHTIKYLEAIT